MGELKNVASEILTMPWAWAICSEGTRKSGTLNLNSGSDFKSFSTELHHAIVNIIEIKILGSSDPNGQL